MLARRRGQGGLKVDLGSKQQSIATILTELDRPEGGELTLKSDGTVEVSKVFRPVQPSDIEILELIGRGVSGDVYRCRYKRDDGPEIMAVKQIPIKESREILQRLVSELHALRVLKHPNTMTLFSAFYADSQINILMPLIDGGSLADFLKVCSPVPEPAIGRLCWFCLQGLQFLRNNLYLHRDLKPSNIMISKKGEVLLADFGMARKLDKSVDLVQSWLGTMCYMSPERIEQKPYTFSSEIWSLGLIIYECALGRFPVLSDDKKVTYWSIMDILKRDIEVNLPDKYSDGLRDFISRCLKVDPEARATVEQLMEHPWVKQFAGEVSQAQFFVWVFECIAKREEQARSRSASLNAFGSGFK